jgi:hypothetical protein
MPMDVVDEMRTFACREMACRFASLRSDDAPDEMFDAVAAANALLCGLSVGPRLGGLDEALDRLYRVADGDVCQRKAVFAAALIRHWLVPLKGYDGTYVAFDYSTKLFHPDEIAAYRRQHPRL